MMRVTNPVMRALLRSPAGGPMRRQFMVLRFSGRKTGRRYDIPVVAHRLDGELYALTDAPWRNNFRDGADVDPHLRDCRRAGPVDQAPRPARQGTTRPVPVVHL